MGYKTQEEYNTLYTSICAEIGDRHTKISALKAQLEGLEINMRSLVEESSKAAQERAKDQSSTTE